MLPRRALPPVSLPPCLLLGLAAAGIGCGGTPSSPGTAVDSVLLITLDTLRADHLSCYGPSPVPTPNIDALRARGALVRHAWTTMPMTTPAHASILTGRHPSSHGVRTNSSVRLPAEVTTLAEVLSAAGRRTAAFVGAYTVSSEFGLGQGFASYDDDMGHDRSGRERGQRPGEEVLARAIPWLEAHADEPFFAWVHLFDPHTPYAPPPEYARRFAGDPYSGEVAYTDALVGRLLAALARTPRAERTAIVLLSDHGEGLGDHGEPEHGLLLYEETLRVPLLLVAPGTIAPGGEIVAPASVIDVLPTVLGWLGLPLPDGVEGRDLLAAPAAERDLHAETLYPFEEYGWSPLFAVRRGELKLIEAPRRELYDLAADPRELNDLAAGRASEVDGLRVALTQALADSSRRAPAAARGGGSDEAADAERIARLESLGYAAGGSAAPEALGAGRAADDLPNPRDRMEDFALFERARLLQESGQPGAAAAILERLAVRDPGNPQIALRLAQGLEQEGDARGAEARYRELLARHASFFPGYRALGILLERQGRSIEARALWLELLERQPGQVGLEVWIARSEINAGMAREAAERMQRVVGERPDGAEAWGQLGRARAALGQEDEAMAAFEQALALEPSERGAIRGVVEMLSARGRREEARRIVERSLAASPGDPFLQETLRSLF